MTIIKKAARLGTKGWMECQSTFLCNVGVIVSRAHARKSRRCGHNYALFNPSKYVNRYLRSKYVAPENELEDGNMCAFLSCYFWIVNLFPCNSWLFGEYSFGTLRRFCALLHSKITICYTRAMRTYICMRTMLTSMNELRVPRKPIEFRVEPTKRIAQEDLRTL